MRLGEVLRWGAIITLWGLCSVVTFNLFMNHPDGASDFRPYYLAAEQVRIGGDPYNIYGYLYPPLLAQLLAPVTALGFEATKAIWFGINWALLVGTTALLYGQLAGLRGRWWLWIVSIFFVPVFTSLWLGQATIVLYALLAGGWMLTRTGRAAWAGMFVSVGMWIKFYPGLLIVYFLWRREWRAVIGAVLAQIVLIALQIVLTTPQGFVDYMTQVLPPLAAAGEPVRNFDNLSLQGFTARLFIKTPLVQPLIERPEWAAPSRYGLALLLLAITAWATMYPHPLHRTPVARFDLEYGLVLIVALLLGATLYHQGTLLLLVTYVGYLLAQPNARMRRAALGWCVVSAALLTLHLFILWGNTQPRIPALLLSLPFFGMLLLGGRIAVQLRHQAVPEAELTR